MKLNSYKRMLIAPNSASLETLDLPAELDDDLINDKIEMAKMRLSQYNGKSQQVNKVVDEMNRLIVDQGKQALQSLRDDDLLPFKKNKEMELVLEIIVSTDGSRPTYLIRDDEVDISSNAAAHLWNDTLYTSYEVLKTVVPNVGRINAENMNIPFAGTGFLIHQNLLVTNRHVLQAFGNRNPKTKKWDLNPTAVVDFKSEYENEAKHVRKIKSVVFAAPQVITAINHQLSDIAILELEPSDDQVLQPFQLFTEFPDNDGSLYTIGYPGEPQIGKYDLNLLDQLFAGEFGCKRLAPGKVIKNDALPPWSFAHDATTLGGSSGSVIIFINQEGIAAGLHYGGDPNLPRQNFAHQISKIGAKDNFSGLSIHESLDPFGIRF